MLAFCKILVLFIISINIGFAQMRGGIKGQVTDENSGDAVPFAQVILLQEDALVQATVTDHNGNYFMGNILPGMYAVLARGQGFSPLKIVEIPLAEGEWLDISPAFANESFDADTLIQQYQPIGSGNPPPKKGGKKGQKPPKTPKKTAYQRKLERAAKKA